MQVSHFSQVSQRLHHLFNIGKIRKQRVGIAREDVLATIETTRAEGHGVRRSDRHSHMVRRGANGDDRFWEQIRLIQMDSLYSSRFSWMVISSRDLRVFGLSCSGATGCQTPGTKTCESINASSASCNPFTSIFPLMAITSSMIKTSASPVMRCRWLMIADLS